MLDRIICVANQCMVHIEGHPCKGLIGTGSMVTTIGESFYKKCLTNCPILPIGNLLRVEGAGGQAIPYLGYVFVPVK